MTVQSQQQIMDLSCLPPAARLSINHCNLPAQILGSLTFQAHPVPLLLDGVLELHKKLFKQLDVLESAAHRASLFRDYMSVYFQLEKLQQAPDKSGAADYRRAKADYLCMLRGWLFDADSREGAILKGWVESRFGLIPRWHKGAIEHTDDEQYQLYLHEKSTGLYNTNALEAQLDLLFSYCQYELQYRQAPVQQHLTLYRGISNATARQLKQQQNIILFNNLNSFSSTRERADEFGDVTIEVQVPLSKIFFYSGLLPGVLHGEDENIVIGGLYQVSLCNPLG